MASPRPPIQCDVVHPTLPVPDVERAVAYYRDLLGFAVEFMWGTPPIHAGVRLGTVSIHLHRAGPEPDGAWVYFVIDDVAAYADFLRANGLEVDGPHVQPWGMRELILYDLNGYRLKFGQHDAGSRDPIPVERVDVHVRLEKRLAALLADLAGHKHMTVGEALEETLLHTFEVLPGAGGVASPHVQRTHEHIAALKRKHGIDYATDDCYRFTE